MKGKLGRQRKIRWSLGCLFLSSLFFFSSTTYASGVEYSIVPEPSEKQANQDVSYYDLHIEPGKKESLHIGVKNNGKREISIASSVKKYTTNNNGVLESRNSQNFESIALPYDIEKLVTIDTPEVTLKPGETKEITYEIQAPDQAFDGVLAGGINFLQKESASDTSSNESGMGVKNVYGYSISLVLEGSKEVNKSKVTSGKVKIGQSNSRNTIFFPIQNESARFLNKTAVEAIVYKKGASAADALYSVKTEDNQVAPSSIFDYPISTNETAFEPGNYVAEVNVSSKGQSWTFKESFEITKKQADKLNKTAVINTEDHTLFYVIGLAIFLIILIVGISVFLLRRKTKQLQALQKNKNEPS